MRFGASTFIWVSPFSNETLDLANKVRSLGFYLIYVCIEDPSKIDTAKAKAAFDAAGLSALVCGAFGPNRDVSSDDEDIRKQGVAYLKICVDIAVALGSPIVSGPMYAATGKTRLLSAAEREQQWSWAVENLTDVADYAAEHNVRLAIEPLNRFETDFINTVEQGLELIRRIDRDNVGFLLDTFHMNIEEKNPAAAVRAAAKKVFHFHASENDRGIPGTGQVPWAELAAALKDIGYDDAVVIESFTTEIKEIARAVSLWRPVAPDQDSVARDGLAFLKRVFVQ